MLRRRFPRAVRCLVMTKDRERTVGVAVIDPVDGVVGDQVGDVSAPLNHDAVGFEHDGIVIVTLAGQHPPVVKSGGVCASAVSQMPLANHGGLPAVVLELLGKRPQAVVEGSGERGHTVDVVVRARQDGGATWGTDRVGAERRIQTDALGSNAVQVGCLVDAAAIRRDRVSGVIVAHDEDNVWGAWVWGAWVWSNWVGCHG